MGLATLGFKVGELVSFDDDDESTGGIVFQISENCDPVKPFKGSIRSGAVDENGKGIEPMKLYGFVRLRPFFSFFPTSRGAKPRGKGGTVLVYHSALQRAKKVDLLALGAKYVELGNLMRDMATRASE